MDKFIKECDCDLIQKLWKPKVGDKLYIPSMNSVSFVSGYRQGSANHGVLYNILISGNYVPQEECIWLPSLSQLIAEIEKLPQLYSWNIQNLWNLLSTERCIRASIFIDIDVIEVKGKTPETACIKALKQVLKEG